MNPQAEKSTTIWADYVITYPDHPALAGAAITVLGDRIQSIEGRPSRSEDLKYPGCTIIPGLFDLHLHLGIESDPDDPLKRKETPPVLAIRCAKNAGITLQSGVTTCRDAGTRDRIIASVREAAAKGIIKAPRLFNAGRPLGAPEGHCNYMTADVRNAGETKSAVRAEVGAGADWIKLMVTGGVVPPSRGTQLTPECVHAAVEEAHRLGVGVMAHCETVEGARLCISAGVDSIEHGVEIEPETLEEMARRGTVLVPTLMAFAEIAQGHNPALSTDIVEKADAAYQKNRQLVARAQAAGVTIAAGTDGSHGNIAFELELLADVGLGTKGALKAATVNAASTLQMEKQAGQLSPGFLADMVVLGGNPLDKIQAVRSVRAVWQAGQPVYAGGREG